MSWYKILGVDSQKNVITAEMTKGIFSGTRVQIKSEVTAGKIDYRVDGDAVTPENNFEFGELVTDLIDDIVENGGV